MNKSSRFLTRVLPAVCCGVGLAGVIAYAAAKEKALSKTDARNAIARIAGLELKKDSINVKEVTALGSSALVVADVETAFRLTKDDKGKWRVAEIRTGDRKWEDVELLVRALDAEKTARARAELNSLAAALEGFRRERGFYVVADTEAALVDQLNPRYTPAVVRIDPWHRPYEYRGARDRYVLRSLGADGKPDTADDLAVTK